MLLPLHLNLAHARPWVIGAGYQPLGSRPEKKIEKAQARVQRIRSRVYKAQEKKNDAALLSLMEQLALAEKALWLLSRDPVIVGKVKEKESTELDDIIVIALSI